MKNTLSQFVVSLTFALVIGLTPSVEAREVIRSFAADVVVQSNGVLNATETITVIAEGRQIRHGIYRDFPRYFLDDNGSRAQVSFKVLSVERNNNKEPWRTETISGGTRIVIGDADVRVPNGEQVYRINYETDRQIVFAEDYEQLVWNVTGDGWTFPILDASARVSLPGGVKPLNVDFYTGVRGSTEQHAFATMTEQGVEFATTQTLNTSEGFTIDVKLPKGTVSAPSRVQKTRWWWRDNLAAVIAYIGFALVVIYFLAVWLRVGRDPKMGAIVPRWDVPEGVSPALASYIDMKGFPNNGRVALAASFIELAVKGYVLLDNLSKSVTIRRTDKPIKEPLPAGQAALIKAVGEPGAALTINRANQKAVQQMTNRFRSAIKQENAGRFFSLNLVYFIAGAIASLAVAAAWFKSAGVFADGLALLFLTGGFTAALGLFIQHQLTQWQYRERAIVRFFFFVVLLLASALLLLVVPTAIYCLRDSLGLATALQGVLIVWGLPLINVFFFNINAANTPAGLQVKEHTAGLRHYLNLVEKDRMNLGGAPQMSPSHYETLLPYAIVLGVERRWSQSFESWFKRAMADSNMEYAPLWYSGHREFSARSMSSLTSSIESSISSSTVSRSSSGSSGGSGSGGGGGGGGGW